MAIKVKAIELGFYDGRRIRAGEVFILKPGHKPGKWMEVVAKNVEEPKAKEPKPKKEVKEPQTFSEINAAAAVVAP